MRQKNKILTNQLEHSRDELNAQQIKFKEKYQELLFQSDVVDKDLVDELYRLNKFKDKLFSIISHDLKNPFNAICGFITLILNRYTVYSDDEKKDLLLIVRDSADDAYRLFENLLQWSRTNLHLVNYKPQGIAIKNSVDENMQLLRLMAIRKEIELINEVEDIVVIADKDMLDTVLRNIISNAIKFTHKKGRVVVKSKRNGNKIQISISDNGVGMTEQTKENLFTDSSLSEVGTAGEGGTGIGLILCKEFIEKHDETIWVESKLGKGTTFYFELQTEL